MKYVIPSLANLLGALTGILAAASLTYIGSANHGQYRFYADFAVHMANRFAGLDVITASVIMGAIVALVISFIVTHVIEKVCK